MEQKQQQQQKQKKKGKKNKRKKEKITTYQFLKKQSFHNCFIFTAKSSFQRANQNWFHNLFLVLDCNFVNKLMAFE